MVRAVVKKARDPLAGMFEAKSVPFLFSLVVSIMGNLHGIGAERVKAYASRLQAREAPGREAGGFAVFIGKRCATLHTSVAQTRFIGNFLKTCMLLDKRDALAVYYMQSSDRHNIDHTAQSRVRESEVR